MSATGNSEAGAPAPAFPRPPRYERLAEALLAAPDPVRAIASELGDQAGRLDAVLRRLSHLEAQVAESRKVRP